MKKFLTLFFIAAFTGMSLSEEGSCSVENNNEGHIISDDPQENEVNNADNLATEELAEEFSEEHVENAPESDEQQ